MNSALKTILLVSIILFTVILPSTGIVKAVSIHSIAKGPTYITEDIEGNVTWGIDGSPYIINKSIEINGRLTIEPGVEVYINNSVILRVSGELYAIGTSDNPIVFRGFGESEKNWRISVRGRESIFKIVFKHVKADVIEFWILSKAYVYIGYTDIDSNIVFPPSILNANIVLENIKVHNITSGERISNSNIRISSVIADTINLGTYSETEFSIEKTHVDKIILSGSRHSNTFLEDISASEVTIGSLASSSIVFRRSVSNQLLIKGMLLTLSILEDSIVYGNITITSTDVAVHHSALLIDNVTVDNMVIESTRKPPLSLATIVVKNSIIENNFIVWGTDIYGTNSWIYMSSTSVDKILFGGKERSGFIQDTLFYFTNITTRKIMFTIGEAHDIIVNITYSKIVNGEGIFFGKLYGSRINITQSILAGNEPSAIKVTGLSRSFPSKIYLDNNWWGDPSGPYHESLNPSGKGDKIEAPVEALVLNNWLNKQPKTPGLSYPKPVLEVNISVVLKGSPILFDASKSMDPDGVIIEYIYVTDPGFYYIIHTNTSQIVMEYYNPPTRHIAALIVVDNNGLASWTTTTILMVLENQLPILELVSPPSEFYVTNKESVTVAWSIENTMYLEKVEVYVNDKLVKELPVREEYNVTIEFTKEGYYNVTIKAITRLGITRSLKITIVYDKTPPTIDLSIEKLSGQEILVKWSAEDALSGVKKVYLVFNGKVVDKSLSGERKLYLKPGDNVIAVKAVDKAGNEAVEERHIAYQQETTTTTSVETKTTIYTTKTPASTTKTQVEETTKPVSPREETTTTTTRPSPTPGTTPLSKTTTKGADYTYYIVGGLVALIIVVAVIALILMKKR